MFKILLVFCTAYHLIISCGCEDYESKVLGNGIPSNLEFAERYYKQAKMQPEELPVDPVKSVDGTLYQVQRRNSELSSALMQLYGSNKFYGKRNPDMSKALLSYLSGELGNKARI